MVLGNMDFLTFITLRKFILHQPLLSNLSFQFLKLYSRITSYKMRNPLLHFHLCHFPYFSHTTIHLFRF